MINAQKRSKDIGKIVHVTSGVQPNFYKATRIIFVRKENNNTNNNSNSERRIAE